MRLESTPCACNCGQFAKPGNRFVNGHNTNKHRTRTPAEAFWALVGQTDDCWEWTGLRVTQGKFHYGRFCVPGQKGFVIQAHRFSYELHFGSIPEGLFVLHRCDNPPCVKPDHLFLGTNEDNVADMVSKHRQTSGERDAQSKLTGHQVQEIRERYAAGGILQRELAVEYGVMQSAISMIVRRKLWHHLP